MAVSARGDFYDGGRAWGPRGLVPVEWQLIVSCEYLRWLLGLDLARDCQWVEDDADTEPEGAETRSSHSDGQGYSQTEARRWQEWGQGLVPVEGQPGHYGVALGLVPVAGQSVGGLVAAEG